MGSRTVGSYEAKTKLAELLDEVGQGQQITITRYGVPVARLVPAGVPKPPDAKEVIREIRILRQKASLKGLSRRRMIEEGRRF